MTCCKFFPIDTRWITPGFNPGIKKYPVNNIKSNFSLPVNFSNCLNVNLSKVASGILFITSDILMFVLKVAIAIINEIEKHIA